MKKKLTLDVLYNMYKSINTPEVWLMLITWMSETFLYSLHSLNKELDKHIEKLNKITLFMKENSKPILDKSWRPIGTKLEDDKNEELKEMLKEKVPFEHKLEIQREDLYGLSLSQLNPFIDNDLLVIIED